MPLAGLFIFWSSAPPIVAVHLHHICSSRGHASCLLWPCRAPTYACAASLSTVSLHSSVLALQCMGSMTYVQQRPCLLLAKWPCSRCHARAMSRVSTCAHEQLPSLLFAALFFSRLPPVILRIPKTRNRHVTAGVKPTVTDVTGWSKTDVTDSILASVVLALS